MAIKNVVFDMGNVLIDFNGAAYASHFADSPEDAAAINEALFKAPIWTLLDSGTISHTTMARYAQARLPERLHEAVAACEEGWPAYAEPIAPTNKLAARLKAQGFGVYLLSNAPVGIIEKLAPHVPAFAHMDGQVVSGPERIMKPDPAIYELLCSRYALDPAECLFIDDNPDNCIGAEVIGMQTFHFTGDAKAAVTKLEAALLN